MLRLFGRRKAVIALWLLALVLAGCAAGENPFAGTSGRHGVAGFWMGLWHGLICWVTFVISLFNRNVHIYEVHNSGRWYDLGFLLGAGITFGGAGRGSNRD